MKFCNIFFSSSNCALELASILVRLVSSESCWVEWVGLIVAWFQNLSSDEESKVAIDVPTLEFSDDGGGCSV